VGYNYRALGCNCVIMSSFDADGATAELRAAAAILNDCCLWQAGKWAAEMCNGRKLSAPRTVNPSGNSIPPSRITFFVLRVRSVA
jgi:hypothetical protein